MWKLKLERLNNRGYYCILVYIIYIVRLLLLRCRGEFKGRVVCHGLNLIVEPVSCAFTAPNIKRLKFLFIN